MGLRPSDRKSTRHVTASSIADNGMLISDHRPVHANVIHRQPESIMSTKATV